MLFIVGDMESKPKAPFALQDVRFGYRMGSPMINTPTVDTMWDAINNYHMGITAENLEVKRLFFKELDSVCPPSTIFTTNTSSLPINVIGEGLSHPVVGMYFFNPALMMKLVEIIKGDETPVEIAEYVKRTEKIIGKDPVIV